MHAYQKGPVIGEGTYGSVICATEKATGRQVAIKKVRLSSNGKDGVNMSVLRELKALRTLAAPHVVELLDTFNTKSSLVLVFEFMEWSLEDVIRDKNLVLSEADVKAYMQMMLQALAHVHGHQAIHRDIKPDNLLISSGGQLKVADFGLARFLGSPTDSPDSSSGKLTPQVFGRWYRPPELLMGSSTYSYGVDMWAAGCVFAELLLRRPWFPGNCDMDQLDRIFKVLGVPTPEIWPGYADLPHRIDFKPAPGQPLQQVFKQASGEAINLLKALMAFDPEQRISAADALAHPYFTSQPAPTALAQLPCPAATRLNRLGLSRVPAVIPDMLMPHRLLQQQQQGFSTAGVAAAGWADAGEAGEALLLHRQQQDATQAAATAAAAAASRSNLAGRTSRTVQAGSNTSRLLAFSDAPSFSGRFLGHGLLPPDPQQQQSQQQQPHPALFAASAGDAENSQEVPWKGRLSFGGILDDNPVPGAASRHSAAAEEAAAAAGGAAGDENAVPSGLPASSTATQQQQQHMSRRPSPISNSNQKGAANSQQTSSSSLRPPLHPNATPVHLRTGQQASSIAAGNSDDRASLQQQQQQQQQQHQQQHRQPGALGAGAGGDPDAAAAARQRRGVSDLSAALTSAAATAAGAVGAANLLNPLAPIPGMLRAHHYQQQQQQAIGGLQEAPGQPGTTCIQPSSTPAAAAALFGARTGLAAAADASAEDGLAGAAEADTACPMSLGTSARKRSRTVFETAPAGAGGGGDGAASMSEQQQQQHGHMDGSDAVMLSSDRRVVRGRRSSVGSGCCSMETDAAEGQAAGQLMEGLLACQQHQQQQQPETAAMAGAAAPPAAGQLSADDRSHSITSDYVQTALAAAAAQGQLHNQQQQQHQRELQETADMPPPHAVQPRMAAAAAPAAAGTTGTSMQQQPRQVAGSSGANGHNNNNNNGGGSSRSGCAAAAAAAAPLPGSGGSTCPMSLDHHQHRPHSSARQQPQQPPGGGSSGSGQQQQQHKQQPHAATASSSGKRKAVEGINSGDLVTGGRPTADELRSMDPAELAELAKFWRPRLDSAERRYLRCRTMQLGEALLQASQPDDVSEGQEYHRFPGLDSSPSAGRGLFDTPAKGSDSCMQASRHEQQQQHTSALHDQHHWGDVAQLQQQPEQQQGLQLGPGATEGSPAKHAAAGPAVGWTAGAGVALPGAAGLGVVGAAAANGVMAGAALPGGPAAPHQQVVDDDAQAAAAAAAAATQMTAA